MTDQRRVVVLGSTGSIGTQAIAVAQAAPDRFRVTAICSGGGDLALLADQAVALRVGRGGRRSRGRRAGAAGAAGGDVAD